MADETHTLSLLQQISDLLGVDPAAFQRLGSPPAVAESEGSVIEAAEVPTVQRLIRAYCALTTDEARLAAIRAIEALAAPDRQLARVSPCSVSPS